MIDARASLWTIAALVGLALAGWFLGPNMLMLGVVIGVLLATKIIPNLAGAPAVVALGIALGVLLFAALLIWVVRSELSYMDLGSVTGQVYGVIYATAGLFGGIAIRALWCALQSITKA